MLHEIVLDTNSVVAGLRSKRGASHEVVRSIGRGGWRLNVSVALALEFEDVLKRNGMVEGITEPENRRPLRLRFPSFQLGSICASPTAEFARPG
jgi:predicted nucleic acid-binding protein